MLLYTFAVCLECYTRFGTHDKHCMSLVGATTGYVRLFNATYLVKFTLAHVSKQTSYINSPISPFNQQKAILALLLIHFPIELYKTKQGHRD